MKEKEKKDKTHQDKKKKGKQKETTRRESPRQLPEATGPGAHESLSAYLVSADPVSLLAAGGSGRGLIS